MMSLVALIIATLCYIGMITVNVLANSLPINNINTGDVSYKYPNLFQPTGLTFSIWGLIYTLLAIFLIYQFVNMNNSIDDQTKALFLKINIFFSFSSLLNMGWLFAWHYDRMILSTMIIIALLAVLLILAKMVQSESLVTRASFSVYASWISVATIANITITLVKLGVPSDTLFAVYMTIFIIFVGLIFSVLWIIREKDIIYGLVIIWAYLGILLRHLSQTELKGAYPIIYISVIFSIILLTFTSIYTYLQKG
jgi:tryptophan-rich sensory protein